MKLKDKKKVKEEKLQSDSAPAIKKLKNKICCNIDKINEDGKELLQYECQLVKVNKDKAASTPDSLSDEDEDEPRNKRITKIIFQSNIDQLKTLISHSADDNEVLLKGVCKDSAQTKRGSFYRGVSLNGKKWQVMVMGNNCKYFSGSIPHEKLAARIYDRFAFQHFGLRTKVNLDYTR